jgi:hypothetical protein
MKAGQVVAVAALVLGAACGDRTTLTLQYRPAAGASFRYALEQAVALRPEGEPDAAGGQDITIGLAFTQSVRGPVEGGTEIRLRVDSVSLASPQLPPEAMANAAGMLRGLETSIVFDARMQVVSSAVADPGGAPRQLAEQIASTLRGASFPLPDGPIRVGQTWSVEAPAPTGQIPGLSRPLMLTSRMRIDRLAVTGADTVVHIEVETAFPRDPITLDDPDGPAAVRFEGTLRGVQEYSLARQALVTATMGGKVRTSVEGQGAYTLEQRMTMRLLEGAATP